MSDEPTLVQMAAEEVVSRWRPGSADWSWAEEWGDLQHDPVTAIVRERVLNEGIGFADKIAPVLLGSDGRVWDGHHRLCLALDMGIETVWVEIAGAQPVSE